MGIFDEEMDAQQSRLQAERDMQRRFNQMADEQARLNEAAVRLIVNEFIDTMGRRGVPTARHPIVENVQERRGVFGQRKEWVNRETGHLNVWVVQNDWPSGKDDSGQIGFLVTRQGDIYSTLGGSWRPLSTEFYRPTPHYGQTWREQDDPCSDAPVTRIKGILLEYVRRTVQ